MTDDPAELVNVRYMVDDVDASIDFYTRHLGFSVRTSSHRHSRTSPAATCGSC